MKRALSKRSLALGVLLVALFGSVAWAKPKIAILGLEVVGDLDPTQTKIAKQLTAGLRDRVSAGTGMYVLAPNSEKEFVDEKFMNNCASEALVCMAPIGAAMRADYLMFGKIQKTQKGFQVTITLVKVSNKTQVGVWSEDISIAEIQNDPKSIAKKAYSKLTPSEEGSLTIKLTNKDVDRATVYINQEPKGTLTSGVLTITLPEGRYTLAVEAMEKGWRRYEESITIHAGDSRNVPVELTKAKKKDPDVAVKDPDDLSHTIEGTESDTNKRGDKTWKKVFWTSAAFAAAAGGTWYYGWQKIKEAEVQLCTNDNPRLVPDGMGGQTVCSPENNTHVPQSVRDEYNGVGSRWKTVTFVAGGVVAVAGTFAIVSFVKGYVSKNEKPPAGGMVGNRKRRGELSVTPIIAPDGGGATLRFDW